MTKIFFDEAAHKYSDEHNTQYTSVTTVVGKYGNEFDSIATALACEIIGQSPGHPKYEKYKGKTADQILSEWNENRDNACENGTSKHQFIEDALLSCSTHEKFSNNQMFTIENIRDDLGVLDIEKFNSAVYSRFPKIYKAIEILHNQGFRFFPELVVFNKEYGISGTIDLFVVKENRFLIIDWKTNRDEIRFESGYFDKDRDGNRTGRFVRDNKKMKGPLFFVPDSTGNHYTLQVSGYAWMAEQFGYSNLYDNNMIFQIRDIDDKETVDIYKLKDMRSLAEKMFKDHSQSF